MNQGSLGSPGPHRLRHRLRPKLAAALVLGVCAATVTAPPAAARAGSACRVEFTRISTVQFNPALGLSGVIIQGSHNYDATTRTGGSRTTGFEVLDSDGFLTLIILLNEWRVTGLLKANQTTAVTVRRADLVLAMEGAERAAKFHGAVLKKANTDTPAPANLEDVRRLLALKLSGFQILADGLRPLLANSQGAQSVSVPAGFMANRAGALIDRLIPPGESMMVQYLDRPTGATPSVYCSDKAASTLIGQLLCGYRFSTLEARTPALCPQGLSLAALSSAPRCKRVGSADQC